MKNTFLKNSLCIVLSLVMVAIFSTGALALSSEDAGDSSIVDWEDLFGPTPSEGLTFSANSDGTYGVSGMGTCTDTRVVIPATYNGASVTTVQARAFANKTSITQVIFPTTMTAISSSAFSGCTGITELEFPESLSTIASRAFEDCTGLTSLYFSANVASIHQYAFMGCDGLTSINADFRNASYSAAGNCLIQKSNKTLLLGCKNSVIPADGSVVAIGNSAFYKCTGLTEITIPESVTTIDGAAFRYCTGLKTVTLPETIQTISGNAFGGCTAITDVYYNGTATGWREDVSVGSGNAPLTGATIHCRTLVGDLTLDDVVDDDDVAYLRYYMADWTEYALDDASVADFNKDGEVNALDVALLKRYVAGWNNSELE